MNQKSIANIILVIVTFILISVVGYSAFVKKSEPIAQRSTASPTPIQTKTSTSTPTPKDETINWKIYQNSDFGFELKHPNSIQVFQSGKYNTPTGEQTIISVSNADVFGIFVDTGSSLVERLEMERKNFGKNILSENKISFCWLISHRTKN